MSQKRDWSVHPGEILREKLDEMGLSGSEAANRMGVSQPYMSALLNGRTGVGAMTALKLEALTGMSAETWMGLQSGHNLFLARRTRPHRRSTFRAISTDPPRTI